MMKPPSHLSVSAKRTFRAIVEEFEVDPASLSLLVAFCESAERREQAAAMLRKDGPTVKDRFGGLRPHPACAIERDSINSMARLARLLRIHEAPEP